MLGDRTENPIRNSAGVTDAPTPTPTSAEPASASPAVGGTAARSTRIPAARKTIPARTK